MNTMKASFFSNDGAAQSSAKDDWGTPKYIFDKYNKIYNFTCDVAASDANHLCEKYFTREQNGLEQDWNGEVCFMNPPYGRGVTKNWVRKAYEESLKGAIVVGLLPARTETHWWHDYCMKGQIEFIRGRLKFLYDGEEKNAAPFASAIIIWK